MKTAESCFECGNKGTNMYGFIICDPCKSKLGLFTDETIQKHILLYEAAPAARPQSIGAACFQVVSAFATSIYGAYPSQKPRLQGITSLGNKQTQKLQVD